MDVGPETYDPFADDAAEEASRQPSHPSQGSKRPRSPKAARAPIIGVNLTLVKGPFLKRRALCAHFLNNDCRWGEDCRFTHDKDELRAGAPETTEIDFSNLESGLITQAFKIPRKQAESIMTEHTRMLLARSAGDCGVTWEAEACRALLTGTPVQVERASQLLKRLTVHCNWGVSQAKIEGLLRPTECSTARIRLAPMATSLRPAMASLTVSKPQFSIGSDGSNDLVVKSPLISRSHILLEFLPAKGALYAVDLSTNGTFLNGVRLPAKSSGKVFVCHGDELLFPEGKKDAKTLEFGYMVNLELL